MKNKKTRGSYYTPKYLSDFILKHIFPYIDSNDKINILEPSVGDGIFIKSLNSLDCYKQKNISFTAIEKYITELRKAEAESKLTSIHKNSYLFINGDFLFHQKSLKKRYQLIVGNPPYIKGSRLNKFQRDTCNQIHASAGLNSHNAKNIWTAFLVKCAQLLCDNGVLAFVLPADLLQVKFSKEIRDYLISQFKRIEIFTFSELLFELIGQDTILIFCFKSASEEGVFYSNIKDINDLESESFTLLKNTSLAKSDIKWTHHLLLEEELSFLFNLKSKLNSVNKYCESKPGIVTAANDYFIINSHQEKEYNLEEYTQRIIQKGFYVNGKIVFDLADIKALEKQGKATKLICFPDIEEKNINGRNKEYINKGKERSLHERYKCSMRKNWYVVPNIGNPPQGFFFKRCHEYPKIIKNQANVLVTDSGYKIQMKEDYIIDNLIYSFYNSLTLTFAELEGRYYGGGVLELTPMEFKQLPLPMSSLQKDEFDVYKKKFENKKCIDDLLFENDKKILCETLKISELEISKIQRIRKKLIEKRFRK